MKTMRILLVEDLDHYQKLYKNLIERHLGHTVEVAPTIAASKDLLNRYTFPVALVDLSLNEEHANRDGFEVLKMIQQLNEGTVSMILTAHGDIPDADKAFRELSISGFISKTTTTLEETKQRILDLIETANNKEFGPLKKINDITTYFTPSTLDWILNTMNMGLTSTKTQELDSFLRRLLVGFSPLLPAIQDSKRMYTIDNHNTVRIPFWSKATGTAIEAWLGDYHTMENALQPIGEKMHLPHLRQEDKFLTVFDSFSFPSFGGVIYALNEVPRDDFVLQLK